jgi:hypothetical protein
MRLFTLILIVIVILAVIGLGWETFSVSKCFLSTTMVVNGRLIDEVYGLILLIDIFPFCFSSFSATFFKDSFMCANTVTETPRRAASRRS